MTYCDLDDKPNDPQNEKTLLDQAKELAIDGRFTGIDDESKKKLI